MKRCPTCKRDYTDESLSFCLDDGSPLTSVGGTGTATYDPNATLVYNAGRATETTAPAGMGNGGSSQAQNPTWEMPTAPAKKSNAVWWVLGIGLLVVGGGGVLLLVGIIGFASYTNSAGNQNSTNSNNTNNTNQEQPKKDPVTTVSDDGRKLVFKDDFSEQKWNVSDESYGKSSYVAGSYQLQGVPDRYFVTYAPSDDYLTNDNTTVTVTVRSVSGNSTKYGYGVAVHGSVQNANATDYAFLIITGDEPQFTIVQHKDGKTTTVKDWTKSSLIRTGTTPNQLSVKLAAGQMTFSINGQYAASVTNDAGYSNGRVGLCLHDSYPVAYDDLEIYR